MLVEFPRGCNYDLSLAAAQKWDGQAAAGMLKMLMHSTLSQHLYFQTNAF
jgi:hypothetical protein